MSIYTEEVKKREKVYMKKTPRQKCESVIMIHDATLTTVKDDEDYNEFRTAIWVC